MREKKAEKTKTQFPPRSLATYAGCVKQERQETKTGKKKEKGRVMAFARSCRTMLKAKQSRAVTNAPREKLMMWDKKQPLLIGGIVQQQLTVRETLWAREGKRSKRRNGGCQKRQRTMNRQERVDGVCPSSLVHLEPGVRH